jgi:hypothetical protein
MRKAPGAPTEICTLYLCGKRALETSRIAAALSLLVAAATDAHERWPRIYGNPTGVRIIYPAAQTPPDALEEAARATGCALLAIDGPADFLVAQCDLAIVASPEEASLAGLLPVLILPSAAGGVCLFDRGEPPFLATTVRRTEQPFSVATRALIATAALAPPRGAHETRKLADYLAEDPDTQAGRHAYDLLLWLVGQRTGGGVPDNSWERALEVARQVRPGALSTVEAMHAAYARADRLAFTYGKRWRSTLVARSLLLLLACICSGLIGGLFPRLSVVTIPIQVAATILIFIDGRHAARNRWREKWLEYRRLAETLRVKRFLALCGVASDRINNLDWVDWMAHRASSPFDMLGEAAAPAVIAHLAAVEIGEQIAYHRDAFRGFRRLDHRLRRSAVIALCAFVVLGAALGALVLAHYAVTSVSFSSAIGLAFTAAPTLYATLNSVRRDLDVTRQARRSADIVVGLKGLAHAITIAPATAEVCGAAGLHAAEIMRDDVSSWHGVIEVL